MSVQEPNSFSQITDQTTAIAALTQICGTVYGHTVTADLFDPANAADFITDLQATPSVTVAQREALNKICGQIGLDHLKL